MSNILLPIAPSLADIPLPRQGIDRDRFSEMLLPSIWFAMVLTNTRVKFWLTVIIQTLLIFVQHPIQSWNPMLVTFPIRVNVFDRAYKRMALPI